MCPWACSCSIPTAVDSVCPAEYPRTTGAPETRVGGTNQLGSSSGLVYGAPTVCDHTPGGGGAEQAAKHRTLGMHPEPPVLNTSTPHNEGAIVSPDGTFNR
jgi:hypothetical protein